MQPLFSIVIANYNYGRFLEDAIRSILSQDVGDQVEIIICDAASTDNSVEVIKKYAGRLPPGVERNDLPGLHLTPTPISWWCSEKDGGQSAAFNKGFSHAHGRFLTWLNADDVFLPGALLAVKREIERHPAGRWFVGGSVWGDAELNLKRCFRAHRFSRLRADTGSLMVGGPSSFFEKSLWEEVGQIDESLHFVMDIDYWYKIYRQAGQTYYRTTRYVWAFRIHENSKMSGPTLDPDSDVSRRNRTRLVEEGALLRSRHGFCVGGWRQKVGALLSTSLVDFILSRWDERRYRGRPVCQIGESL